MEQHEKVEDEGKHDTCAWSLIERGVEEDAAAADGLWLVAQTLQPKDKKTVGIIHLLSGLVSFVRLFRARSLVS